MQHGAACAKGRHISEKMWTTVDRDARMLYGTENEYNKKICVSINNVALEENAAYFSYGIICFYRKSPYTGYKI